MSFPGTQDANPKSRFESRITAAIEQQTPLNIPADFAARVTSKAATLPQRSRAPRAHYARVVSMVFSALLLVALFVLAPHAQPSFSSLGFDLELTAVALLSALAYGLTQTRKDLL